MSHLKTVLSSGVFALGTAFAASADDLIVTKECAESALESTLTFGQEIEIGHEDNGLWALTHFDEIDVYGKMHSGTVSGIITMDATNTLKGISASITEGENTAQADLKFDQENPEIQVTSDGAIVTTPSSPSIESDLLPSVAAAVVSKLNEKLRECAQPQTLSRNVDYSPLNLG